MMSSEDLIDSKAIIHCQNSVIVEVLLKRSITTEIVSVKYFRRFESELVSIKCC